MAKIDEVKQTAQQRLQGVKQSAQEKTQGFTAKAKEATPESASAGASQVATAARDNPVPVAVAGAFLAGVAFGWLLRR